MNEYIPVVGSRPTPTDEQLHDAAVLDEEARTARREREDSFARCDTDGFVSQWASGLSASLSGARAQLLRDGGHALFLGLFRRNTDGTPGERVIAKLRTGEWGDFWSLCDESGRPTGVCLPAWKTTPSPFDGTYSRGLKRSKAWRAGYVEAYEWAPAAARLGGRGTGLSGTAWVEVFRTDDITDYRKR
jgi:hypothetical protein